MINSNRREENKIMVKVIETNLSIQPNNEIIDHQSRVIEVESWDSYVNEIREARTITRNGTLYGASIPKESRVENFECDEFHLSCDVYNYANMKTMKLA